MRSSGSRSDGGLLWHRKLAFWMVVPIENPLEHLFFKTASRAYSPIQLGPRWTLIHNEEAKKR